MDSGQVPLWAFLVTTLAAVVGPIAGLFVSNRNAVKLLREQHQFEGSKDEQEKKEAAYIEALTTYMPLATSFSKYAKDDETFGAISHQLRAVHAKIVAYGSVALVEKSSKVLAEALGLIALHAEYLQTGDPDAMKMREGMWKVFLRDYSGFEQEVQRDLAKEPFVRPPQETLDPDKVPEFFKKYMK